MLITYPVIKSEIQEDEIWDLTAIREIPQEVECGEYAVFRNLVSRNMRARARARARAHTHTHRQKETDDQLDAECRSASSVSVRHELEKLCHTRPGDEPFKTDAGNKCLSVQMKKKLLDGLRGRRTENPAKIIAVVVYIYFTSSRPAPGPPGFLQTSTQCLPRVERAGSEAK